jgi:hypothetical protein
MSTVIPKVAGLVTLRYVVMSTLNRLNDYTLKNYKRFMQICIECVTEQMSLYHTGIGNEVVYLHMSTAKTVNLPADFVNWSKVGFPYNGKFRVITNHDGILLPRVFDDTGVAVGNTDGALATEGISNAIFFSDHFRNGQFIGGLYGLPGAIDEAYFRFDMENRQIVFSGETTRSEIVLEYTSSGLKPDGSSLIPREIVSPVRNYILWQMVEHDPRIAYNERERRKREFEESIEELRWFENSFTKDDYLRMVYSTARQSPRR